MTLNRKKLLQEVRDYLQCVIDQSMSRNNAEQLAAELVEQINSLSAAQEERETAIAWLRAATTTPEYGGWEVCKAGDANGFPVYLAPPSSNQVWNEAVEAAAKVCEGHTFGSPVAAHAIRSLKRPLQAQEQPSAVGNFGDSAQAQIAERARSMALPDYRDASASGAVDDLPPLPEPDVNGPHIDGYSSSVVEAIQREAYELGLSRAQAAQQVEFTDAWQAKHTLTLDGAAKELKAFYDAWPGGLEEIESAIKTARTQAAQQAQPVSDAMRYEYLRHRTRGTVGSNRFGLFVFPSIEPINYILKGSVAEHLDDAIDAALQAGKEPKLTRCAASRDGECGHVQCPQLRDGEPAKTGRHCPLDTDEDDE